MLSLLCSCDWCFTNQFHHTQNVKYRVLAETTFVCTNQRCRAPIIFVESTFVCTNQEVQRTGNICRITKMKERLRCSAPGILPTDNIATLSVCRCFTNKKFQCKSSKKNTFSIIRRKHQSFVIIIIGFYILKIF